MGRKVTVGVLAGGVDQLVVDRNTFVAAQANANLVLDTSGTGVVESLKAITIASGDLSIVSGDLAINAQGSLILRDSANTRAVTLQPPATLTSSYTITLPAAAPVRNGYVLTSTTAGVATWSPAQSFAFSVEDLSFNAEAYGAYFVDTSSNAVTVTLPASPSTGDTIRFFDIAKTFDTNVFTVGRNGKLIQGDAEDLVVSTESAAFELVFSNDTYGWRIFSI